MVVRILTYGAESREAAEDWIREHADTVRDVPGIERVVFMQSMVPPQVGAVMVFESDDALARYETTGPHERLVESLQQVRVDGDGLVRDEAYWIGEV